MLPYAHGSAAITREYAGGSVGGILRKRNAGQDSGFAATSNAPASTEDLLVFGYACKIFRDDSKALDIDQGKHLIPWMGDNNLKIDRYDVRGALYDLAPHEPPPGGYGNRLDYLSAEEQRAEMLCEEERYLFLYNNEEELMLQQEEDLKRLQMEANGSSYGQVNFQYGNESAVAVAASAIPSVPNRDECNASPSNDEVDQPFQLPYNFDVPDNMQLPETMKQHAIIEKTARFIATQGVQMEILLKAKQSNNVQFEFLSAKSPLNPYYKHMIDAIKNDKYPSYQSQQIAAAAAASAASAIAVDTGASCNANDDSATTYTQLTVPTIKYKPSANCAYTQLISKIKGVPLPEYLDECSNISGMSSPSTPTSSNHTPALLQNNGNFFAKEASNSLVEDENSNSNSQSKLKSSATTSPPKVEVLKNTSALALAQDYASDSEDEQDEVPAKAEPVVLNFPLPAEPLRNIIDKTGQYVIKNGRQFEETLRTKDAERFSFLTYENEFYPYYMYKITNDPDAASKEQKTRKAAAVAAALLSKKGLLPKDKAVATALEKTPVSFSIKAKDENATAGLPPALPQEPSDDDEESNESKGNAANKKVPESVQKAIKLVESQLMARNAQLNLNTADTNSSHATRFDIKELHSQADSNNVEQSKHKEQKQAEDKIKDKLAQIAREKLGGMISREKEIQLERKRKAMAFLNKIGGNSPCNEENNARDNFANCDEKANAENKENSASDSETSVHSIPITSYGPEEAQLENNKRHRTQSPLAQSDDKESLSKKRLPKITTTVTLSDDDEDVQVVGEIKPADVIRQKLSSKSGSTTVANTARILKSKRKSRSPVKLKKKKSKHSDSYSSDSSNHTSDSDTESSDSDDDEAIIAESKKREHRRHKSKHKSKSKKSHKSSHKKAKAKHHEEYYATCSDVKVKTAKNRSRSRSRSRQLRKESRSRLSPLRGEHYSSTVTSKHKAAKHKDRSRSPSHTQRSKTHSLKSKSRKRSSRSVSMESAASQSSTRRHKHKTSRRLEDYNERDYEQYSGSSSSSRHKQHKNRYHHH